MLSYECQLAWDDTKLQIKRRVSLPDLLRDQGVKVRTRGRADCPFCEGSQRGTMAFTQELFKCHRCAAGGDIFSFIALTHGGDFKHALEYAARLARIDLPGTRQPTPEEKRQWAERKRREEEVDAAAEAWKEQERAMRLACRTRIHECDQILTKPEPWSEHDWQRAQAAFTLRQSLLLEYSLLCFGSMEQRFDYVFGESQKRDQILAEIRRIGAVVDSTGYWMEVWQ